MAHVATSERYDVIKRYKQHIWFYSVLWVGLTLWFFKPMADWNFILWLIPGGSIALAYVLPFLSKGRRLRDLGWIKIVLIGWSWGWLTAFLPAYYFEEIPLHLSIIHFVERMLFIIMITIPFEIRDMSVDRSVGLTTMPVMLGMKRTLRTGYILCGLVILLAFFLAFHFFNFPYLFSMMVVCALTVWILKKSQHVHDDYFFGGLTDGLMIIALMVYWFIVKL